MCDAHVPLVALPSTVALGWFIALINMRNGRRAIGWVGDVGPWNTHDNVYVLDGARPQSESGRDEQGRVTNRSGLDMGGRVWSELAMVDSGHVAWTRIVW